MKINQSRITTVKLVVIGLAVLFGAAVFFAVPNDSGRVAATSNGPSPSFTGAPGENNCTVCHGSFDVNSGSGGVVISGIPANYRPGQQIPVTVTVTHPGAVVFGFQLTAIDNLGRAAGTLVVPPMTPQQLQLRSGLLGGNNRSYIEHTIDGITPTVFDTKSWTFNWTAPATRVGRIGFYAAGNGGNDGEGAAGDYIYTTSRFSLAGTAISNFDTDTRSDLAVFRPSTGTWYTQSSQNGFGSIQFGQAGDRIVPGDYDGDGKTDHAVWRASNGNWYVLKSSGGYVVTNFGVVGDIPVQGDYDGDGKTDVAVWRPSNNNWYILTSEANSFIIRNFGSANDRPVPADFDGDGKTDIAVFRSSDGNWYRLNSSNGAFVVNNFGILGDMPLPGDFDGDGKADLSVFRASSATWYRQNSNGFSQIAFGALTDVPVPGDYDGDGKTDVAVYRNGTWFILGSLGSYNVMAFGETGDIPVPTGYHVFD